MKGQSGLVLGYNYNASLYKHGRSYVLPAVSLGHYKHFGQSYWLGLALFQLFLLELSHVCHVNNLVLDPEGKSYAWLLGRCQSVGVY